MISDSNRAYIENRIHRELCRSVTLHGDWSDLSFVQMFSVIVDELLEVESALDTDDFHGVHGVYNELAQVAACCQKMMAQIVEKQGTGVL
jgi:hypothetical protein